MLTVKDNISVRTITFDFIRSSRTIIGNQVTVPLNSFRGLELTATDSRGNEVEHRAKFESLDRTTTDTYVVSEDTFNLLYSLIINGEVKRKCDK